MCKHLWKLPMDDYRSETLTARCSLCKKKKRFKAWVWADEQASTYEYALARMRYYKTLPRLFVKKGMMKTYG